MSKYLFDFICPACGQGDHGVFYHKCGGKRYIDEDLYLYCDKCSDKTYLFDSTFKCEYHDDYRKANKMIMMKGLSVFPQFTRFNSIDEKIIKKMMENVWYN